MVLNEFGCETSTRSEITLVSSTEIQYPWRRFFARTMDMFLFSIVAAALCELNNWTFILEHTILFSIIVSFAWIVIEAILIAAFGTTPGKKWISIRLEDLNGERLTYLDALKRSIRVYTLGLGLGIPGVSFITEIINLFRLSDGKPANYDDGHDYKVVCDTVTTLKTVTFVICIIIIFALNVINFFDQFI